MEGVPEPTPAECRQFQVLTTLVLAWILVAVLAGARGLYLLDAVPPGEMTILAGADSRGRLWGDPLEERGPISPRVVRLNEATPEELAACPGVGPVLAARIREERAKGPFRDWEDLARRVPGIGDGTLDRLREAGVTLGP